MCREVLFEHGKLCVEMADRVSAPRAIANACWRPWGSPDQETYGCREP
ncbi:hypothetical protein ACWDZ8_25415 [Streptomyces sp. NPDC003233]